MNSVNSALNQSRTALNNMKEAFDTDGLQMGQGLVNGLKTGLAPSPSVVRTALSTAVSSNLGTADD